jgi:hypothetical protein
MTMPLLLLTPPTEEVSFDGTYRLLITPESLTLQTFLYKAEKGSIIHTALMNREVTSLMVATILSGVLFVIYAMNFPLRVFELINFCILTGALFLFLRLRIFREKPLEVIFSRDLVSIRYPSFIIKRVENFDLNQVKSISIKKEVFKIDNIEGARIVKQVALQHGTVLPDFTEPEEFFLLQMELQNGSRRVIYVDREPERISALLKELKKWSEIIGLKLGIRG